MTGEQTSELRIALDGAFDRPHARLKGEEGEQRNVRWGGCLRRVWAFLIDAVVLWALSLLLFYLGYVGYKIGLAASGNRFTLDDFMAFLRISIWSWLFLTGGYFVLLHGMDGRTVGKWLLGLRVVAAERVPVTYGQALIRWLGCLPSAFFGLGFLWILLNRERRGWPDLLAGTWVIRENRAAGTERS